jgi:hypothetical protein
MSNVYGAGPGGPFAGGAPPQYTPNQLLAQQYGQGSRAFYSPFNSPYRPQGVPAGGFQPPRGYGGGYGGMFGGMPGQLPPGMPGPSVYQPQVGMQQPQGAAGDYYHALSQQMGGSLMAPTPYGGMAPGFNGFSPAMAQAFQQMPGPPPQTGAQYGLDAMRNFQQQQNAGGTGQSARQYGLNAVQNIASQQNAGPPPSGYQPGSFSAGVAALNRGNPNAQNMLGQAAGLPAQSGRDYGLQATQNFASQQNAGPSPAPAQPFGPAFRNAVNQLQVRPPAPPQRLPYQPGATAQMMQLGRRAPGLPATNQAGRTSSGIQPASGMAPPPPRGSDRGDLSGYDLNSVDPSRRRY